LFECLDKEEMNQMEKFFITNYKATNNLYNLTPGGDGGNGRKGISLSEEHKRKISEAQKGRKLS
jgi:hypothetical protein